MNLKTRLKKLEDKVNMSDREAEARKVVDLDIVFGIVDRNDKDKIEMRVKEYVEKEITLEKILHEVNGTKRGLPSIEKRKE